MLRLVHVSVRHNSASGECAWDGVVCLLVDLVDTTVSSFGGVLRKRDDAAVGRQVRKPMFHRCVKSRRRRRTTQKARWRPTNYTSSKPPTPLRSPPIMSCYDTTANQSTVRKRSRTTALYTKAENKSASHRNFVFILYMNLIGALIITGGAVAQRVECWTWSTGRGFKSCSGQKLRNN